MSGLLCDDWAASPFFVALKRQIQCRMTRSLSTPFLMLGGWRVYLQTRTLTFLWRSFGGIHVLKTNALHFLLLLWWLQVKSWDSSSYWCLPPCSGHHLSKHCSERILEYPFPSCWHYCIPPWSSLSSSLRHTAFLCYCKHSQKNGRGEGTGVGVAASLYLRRIHDIWQQKLHIPITRCAARHVRDRAAVSLSRVITSKVLHPWRFNL